MVENITPKRNAAANVNVTYYTLVSDYEGDYTKNCALLGTEIDGNFYFLRGNDIKSFDVIVDADGTKHLILTRYNGEILSGFALSDDVTSDFKFEYDAEKGEILITYPSGREVTLAPFNQLWAATDSTILGGGEPENPLRLSELEKTGTYAPVKELVDVAGGEEFPKGEKLGKGYRVVSRERNSRFGLLYNYDEISKIDAALKEIKSPWRVPTLEDWNSLLNSIECEGTPHNAKGEGEFGEDAGALLKSAGHELWKEVYAYEECEVPTGIIPVEKDKIPSAPDKDSPEYIIVKGVAYKKNLILDFDGEDAYGFNALPMGYAGARANFLMDADNDIEGYGLCTSYWTSTPAGILEEDANGSDAIYTKSLWYKTRRAIQQILSKTSRLSLRLVKDFARNNFEEQEEILGSFYPCVHINADNGDAQHNKIWTSINVSISDFGGVQSDEWESDAEYKTKYFVCEWDGTRWRKKEMRIGDSVVILDAEKEDGSTVINHEWRVFEGENGNDILVDTIDALSGEIAGDLANLRKELIQYVDNSVSNLSGNVINYIDQRVDELSGNVSTSIENLSGDVISYVDQRVDELSGNVETAIFDLSGNVSTAINELSGNVETSINDLSGKVSTAISELSGNVETTINELSGNVSTAISELSANVTTAIENLTEEAKQYTDEKVAELSGNVIEYVDNLIETEKEDRIANDIAQGEYTIGGGSEKAEIKNNSGDTVITIVFDGNFGTI